LLNVYNENETWVYLNHPPTSMWIGANVTRPT
jgi:hypothetical protein